VRRSGYRLSGQLLLAGCLIATAVMVNPVLAAGFSVDVLDPANGQSVRLEPGAEALHLIFFATWCPACLEEFEALRDVEARWGESGYRLVLVAVKTRHSATRLVSFVEDNHPPGEMLLDSQGAAEKQLSVTMLPEHLLFDRTGREVARSDNLKDILPVIEELFAGSRRGARRGS